MVIGGTRGKLKEREGETLNFNLSEEISVDTVRMNSPDWLSLQMSSAKNIVELRQLLAERWPGLRLRPELAGRPPAVRWETGLSRIDSLLEGGLKRGGVTELVCSTAAAGGALLLRYLLRQSHRKGEWAGLIDGFDSFDPAPFPERVLARLLWVRCQDTSQALKAADLLLRDGNLPLVLLDLQINPGVQLGKIPASTWHRFQRLTESTGTALLVITPHSLVGKVRTRLVLSKSFPIQALEKTDQELMRQLESEVLRTASPAEGHRPGGGRSGPLLE